MDHPQLPSVMLLPQYSHVIIITPNFGAIGAPQLGHFREVAVEGALTGAGGVAIPDDTMVNPERLKDAMARGTTVAKKTRLLPSCSIAKGAPVIIPTRRAWYAELVRRK